LPEIEQKKDKKDPNLPAIGGSVISKVQRFQEIAIWHGFCFFTAAVKAEVNYGAFEARHPKTQDQAFGLVLQPPPKEAKIPDLAVPQSFLRSPQVILRNSPFVFCQCPILSCGAAITSSLLDPAFPPTGTSGQGSSWSFTMACRSYPPSVCMRLPMGPVTRGAITAARFARWFFTDRVSPCLLSHS